MFLAETPDAMQPQDSQDKIDHYVSSLKHVFKLAPDKHEAHRRSRSILEDMASDPGFLPALLARLVNASGTFARKHYPVVGYELELNEEFALAMNGWVPLPGRETDIATKAIHHHGNMLLTTTTAFGPGYEHWTFTTPRLVDADR